MLEVTFDGLGEAAVAELVALAGECPGDPPAGMRLADWFAGCGFAGPGLAAVASLAIGPVLREFAEARGFAEEEPGEEHCTDWAEFGAEVHPHAVYTTLHSCVVEADAAGEASLTALAYGWEGRRYGFRTERGDSLHPTRADAQAAAEAWVAAHTTGRARDLLADADVEFLADLGLPPGVRVLLTGGRKVNRAT